MLSLNMRCNGALSISRFSEAFASRLPIRVSLRNSKAVTTPPSSRIAVCALAGRTFLDSDRLIFRQSSPVFAQQKYIHVWGNQTRDSVAPTKALSKPSCESTSTRVYPSTSTSPSASRPLVKTTAGTTLSDRRLQPSTLSRRSFSTTHGRLLATYTPFPNGAPPTLLETPTRAERWQALKEDFLFCLPILGIFVSVLILGLYCINEPVLVDRMRIRFVKYFTYHRVDWLDKLYSPVGYLASQFTHISWKPLLFDSMVLIACVGVIRPFTNQSTLFTIYIMAGLFAALVDCAWTRTINSYRNLSRDESIKTQMQIQEDTINCRQTFRQELKLFLTGEGTWRSIQDKLEEGIVLYTKKIAIDTICERSFGAGGPLTCLGISRSIFLS